MKKTFTLVATFLFTLGITAQITPGFTNDFEDFTTQGWSNGAGSPNPPTNITTGGPDGVDDNFLEKQSAGGAGAGSKMIVFNTDAGWLGDYFAAGIGLITFNAKNPSNEDLTVRFAMQGAGDNTQISTTEGVLVPAQSDWELYELAVEEIDFTIVGGASTVSDVLADVNQVRILHNTVPAWIGGTIEATLHLDNITADPILSITDNKLSGISLFPNPASSMINFSAETGIDSYRIYNVLGAQVMAGSVNSQRSSVDISELSEGMYLIEFTSEGEKAVKKFLKQ